MLKSREHNALRFLKLIHDQTGLMPSYSEIGAAIGLRSRSAVHRIVHDLADRGYITAPTGRRQPFRILIDLATALDSANPILVPGGAFLPEARYITRTADDLASQHYDIRSTDMLILEMSDQFIGGSLSVVEIEPQRYSVRRLIESPEGLHFEEPDGSAPRPLNPASVTVASRVITLIRKL